MVPTTEAFRKAMGRFATGARYRYTKAGTPLLETCLAQLECRVTAAYEQGEHVKTRDGRPLLFYGGRYRKLEAD